MRLMLVSVWMCVPVCVCWKCCSVSSMEMHASYPGLMGNVYIHTEQRCCFVEENEPRDVFRLGCMLEFLRGSCCFLTDNRGCVSLLKVNTSNTHSQNKISPFFFLPACHKHTSWALLGVEAWNPLKWTSVNQLTFNWTSSQSVSRVGTSQTRLVDSRHFLRQK